MDLHLFDLNLLVALDALLTERNVTRAGNRLNLSQSAMSGALARLRASLAAVGQMALSNYLSQSVITAAIFLGCGLGLAGRFDYAEQLIVVVAIWALQLAISPIWLRRYSFGPAEWLWRSLTYGKRQPMRRDAYRATPGSGVIAGA